MTDDLELVSVVCPACYAEEAIYLGRMGALRWFRCQACGMEYNLQERETAHERLLRLFDEAGYQVCDRGHDFTLVATFERTGGDRFALQWAVQAPEGEPVRVRKLLDYDGWRPAAEPSVPAVLSAIEAAEIADSLRGWPEQAEWHVTGLVRL